MSRIDTQQPPAQRTYALALVFGAIIFVVGLLSLDNRSSAWATGGASLIVLAPVTFLAGLLSFLSPCCLPVLSAYVAYTSQVQRERLMLTTLAFFGGVATTMVALGASATALSRVLFQYLPALTTIGGLLIIGFGIMSLLGRGFSGVQIQSRIGAGATGAYVYGATFALGWTACVGPILGALLTMLATQGLAVVQGAILAFIYALGLGTPLIALSSFLSRRERQSRLWAALRGHGFTLTLGQRTLYLHTTSIASGILLIFMGVLLATGQLSMFSKWAMNMPLTQWVLTLEESLRALLMQR